MDLDDHHVLAIEPDDRWMLDQRQSLAIQTERRIVSGVGRESESLVDHVRNVFHPICSILSRFLRLQLGIARQAIQRSNE